MNDQDLLEYSRKVKLQAKNILEKNKVVEILKKYGDVIISGSYKFDLMYGPDIDLEVITDNPREASLEALQDFIKSRKFQKYEYGDFKKFPRKHRPESFIVVLVQKIDGLKWEIEIWFFKGRDKEKEEFEEKLMNLSREERLKILKLKDQREQSGLSKHKTSSFEIYEAVLENDLSELNKLLRKGGGK